MMYLFYKTKNIHRKEVNMENQTLAISQDLPQEKTNDSMQKPYVYKYDSAFAFCHRRNIGTYPKFLLSAVKFVLRFVVRTMLRHRIEIVARGRGPRPQGCMQDLPIALAKKVALYITIFRR